MLKTQICQKSVLQRLALANRTFWLLQFSFFFRFADSRSRALMLWRLFNCSGRSFIDTVVVSGIWLKFGSPKFWMKFPKKFSAILGDRYNVFWAEKPFLCFSTRCDILGKIFPTKFGFWSLSFRKNHSQRLKGYISLVCDWRDSS